MQADEAISSIKAVIDKATAGPWHPGCIVDDTSTCNCRSICDEGYAGGIATVHLGNGLPIGEGGNDAPPLEEAKANCAYIAACNPEAVGALLAEIETLRAERDAIRAETIEEAARHFEHVGGVFTSDRIAFDIRSMGKGEKP